MEAFFNDLIAEPSKLAGFISAIFVGLLALINIVMFFRPSARLKRAENRKKYQEHKKLKKIDKLNHTVTKQLNKHDKTRIKELGYKNVYTDDLIELSSHNKKIKLVFKLDDDVNTSFAQELTNAYKHAANAIESGKAKLILG